MRCSGAARLTRTWGDGYGYLMVATGRAEVMIDPELDIWDAGGAAAGHRRSRRHVSAIGRAAPTVHSRDAIATNGLVTRRSAGDHTRAVQRGSACERDDRDYECAMLIARFARCRSPRFVILTDSSRLIA